MLLQEKLQGLTRLIVTVADQNTKLILAQSRGACNDQRQTVLALVHMVLVSESSIETTLTVMTYRYGDAIIDSPILNSR